MRGCQPTAAMHPTEEKHSTDMKRKILFAAALIAASAATALQAAPDENAVLLTVNGEPSTVGEFMYIYQKNNNETLVDHKTIDEYLSLFINFKLKVAEAKAQGIDTTASFRKELEGYRRQAIPKYMSDPASEEAVIQKAYGRMLNDRKVSHIAVRCPENATAEEEAAAREKIDRALLRVTTGVPVIQGKGKRAKVLPGKQEDFNEVAVEMSEDPSAADNQGRIGWVRPFRFVFPFEEAAYSTAVGEVSGVVRTPFGFHILKVEEETPHREVHARHLMKMTPRGNDSLALIAKQQIDSLYVIAKSGADFAELAMSNSDDRGSAMRGGDLGWFGKGQMVPEFEDAAFSLTEDGELSEPVRSAYGWHIIRYEGSRGTADLAEIHEEVRKNVMRSEYRQLVSEGFLNKLKQEYAFSEDKAALEPLCQLAARYGGIGDSAFLSEAGQLEGTIIRYAGKTGTLADLAAYIRKNPFSQKQQPEAQVEEKYNLWTESCLRQEEDANLENKYPELRHLMQEYHDGILLFEVSLKEVWDKASQDTAGLKAFFKEHQKDYTWSEPRYKGYVVYCKDKALQKAAKQIITTADPDSVGSYIDHRLNLDSVKYVRAERGLWKAGDNKAVDKYGLKVKKAEYTPDEALPIVFCIGKKLKNPEEYTDERGKVTSAYQDWLEKEWVKQLRAKYPVSVNEDVLNALKAEE